MSHWSDEAHDCARRARMLVWGKNDWTPCEGLAFMLARRADDELEWEAPLGQWEAMMAAL